MTRNKSTIKTGNGDFVVMRKSRRGKRISEVTIRFPENKTGMEILVKSGKNGDQRTEAFALDGMISFFATETGEPEVILTL